jgi:hypothetical protein
MLLINYVPCVQCGFDKTNIICMPHNLSTRHNNSPVTSVSKEMLITLNEFKHHYTHEWRTVTRLFNIPINLLQVTMLNGELFLLSLVYEWIFPNSVVLNVTFTFKVIGLILLMRSTVCTRNMQSKWYCDQKTHHKVHCRYAGLLSQEQFIT